MRTAVTHYELLGVPVELWTEQDLTALVLAAAASEEPLHIGHVNFHSLAVARRNPRMAEFYRTALARPIDGMPVLWLARMCGIPAQRRHRVTYVDWIRPLLREVAKADLRVFFLGGRPGLGERAKAQLEAEIQGLRMETHHGYFTSEAASEQNRAVLALIRQRRPDVLLVGMGMPRQEEWIMENRRDLPPCVSLAVGACMDYIVGEIATPPRWLGRLGFEWAARLVREPRRLSHRYLIEPWSLLPAALRDMLRRGRH